MKCWICNKEMENTIGGCYHCKDCGVGVGDLVFRTPIKNKENTKTAENISELQDPKPTIINSSELGTLGAYFDAAAAQDKVKKLEKQLAEKNKRIEKLKDKMETWQSELFDKLTEVTQMIDDYSVEIPMGDKTPSLMLIGSKEFENVIDEIIDKFTR